ncbi:MAG TPA: DUF5131 family protein, partial [Phycisphaerae bacterium]|nr:DUF5131 family protein [Phycisphaerae bacterium]
LMQTPLAIRGVSLEPLLGPVDLAAGLTWTCLGCNRIHPAAMCDCGDHAHGRLDWGILGGETGPGARPMHPDWARRVRDDCQAAGAKFFFKGWGGWKPVAEYDHGSGDVRRRDIVIAPDGRIYTQDDSTLAIGTPPAASWQMRPTRTKCRILGGREWNEVPEAHRDK